MCSCATRDSHAFFQELLLSRSALWSPDHLADSQTTPCPRLDVRYMRHLAKPNAAVSDSTASSRKKLSEEEQSRKKARKKLFRESTKRVAARQLRSLTQAAHRLGKESGLSWSHAQSSSYAGTVALDSQMAELEQELSQIRTWSSVVQREVFGSAPSTKARAEKASKVFDNMWAGSRFRFTTIGSTVVCIFDPLSPCVHGQSPWPESEHDELQVRRRPLKWFTLCS